MSEMEYRNRHGRVVSVDDSPDELPPAPVKEPPKKRSRTRRRHQGVHRKYIILASVIIAVIILIPVIIGEFVRSSYSSEVASAKNSVHTIVERAKNYPADAKLSAVLKTSLTDLSAVTDGLCKGGFMDNIAKYYPRSSQAFRDCNDYKSRIAGLSEQVAAAAEQMQYLESLQVVLQGVSKPLEDKFAVLASQQESWQNLVNNLKQLSVPASFGGAHSNLVKQAEAVRDQWIALVQAANIYDSSSFSAAQVKLGTAYEEFRKAADGYDIAIQTTQQSIKDKLSALSN